MDRIENIVGKIKGQVVENLPALVHRDRELLATLCEKMGLAKDLVHMAQVAVLMKLNMLTTYEEYPKMVYPNGPERPGVTVADAAEERRVMAKKPALEAVK